MNKFFEVPEKDKIEILQQAGEQSGLPAYAVEKDWWVVQTLTILFEMEIASHLVFKGGTSLSKAWNLIERFSEDIDLAVDRTFFGFEGDLNKSQRTKLRKTSKEYITEVVFFELERKFQESGLTGLHIDLEEIKSSDQDPVIINVSYPNVIESPGYLKPRVQIEIGCRSLHEPYTIKPILSTVDETFPDQQFSLLPIHIPAVNPERTFLEKLFLLYEEFQRPKEKIRVDRLSRHLYDIERISHSKYLSSALNDPELFRTIVAHRKQFVRLSGVDYSSHFPPNLNPIPPDDLMKDWERDYQTMNEQMIYGKKLTFSELIKNLRAVVDKINSSEIRSKGS